MVNQSKMLSQHYINYYWHYNDKSALIHSVEGVAGCTIGHSILLTGCSLNYSFVDNLYLNGLDNIEVCKNDQRNVFLNNMLV